MYTFTNIVMSERLEIVLLLIYVPFWWSDFDMDKDNLKNSLDGIFTDFLQS